MIFNNIEIYWESDNDVKKNFHYINYWTDIHDSTIDIKILVILWIVTIDTDDCLDIIALSKSILFVIA